MGNRIAKPQDRSTCSTMLDKLPDLVTSRLVEFLPAEDIVSLSKTCRHMKSTLPYFKVIHGEDFCVRGPSWGHWHPELYFDSPRLPSVVKGMMMSATWKDQGWGNRKGEIFVQLIRPVCGGDGGEEIVAEKSNVFGVAEHSETTPKTEIRSDPVVTQAQPGDFYRFMRNAGGGGGHELSVRNFRVVLMLIGQPSSTPYFERIAG